MGDRSSSGPRGRASHVAFLRGINVGGKHKLPMKEVVKIFEASGCTAVTTHLQSGNVLFQVSRAKAGQVADEVSAAIKASFGFEVPVFLRTTGELRAIAEESPFLDQADPSKLHVAFLAQKPAAAKAAALDPDRSPPDAFVLEGREIHLHCPKGFARTKLTNAYFDRVLETVCTVRTRKTLLRLIELAG